MTQAIDVLEADHDKLIAISRETGRPVFEVVHDLLVQAVGPIGSIRKRSTPQQLLGDGPRQHHRKRDV